MIIGNGLVANAIRKIDRENFIFFASGVSDSKCENEAEFKREFDLLKQQLGNADNTLIYFSTASILDPLMQSTRYVRFKKEMEAFIPDSFEKYLIIRASNIIGQGGNSKTIVNFLYDCVSNKQHFSLWSGALRNILDTNLLVAMVEHYVSNFPINKVITIGNCEDVTVIEILRQLEQLLGLEADFEVVEMEETSYIDKKLSQKIAKDLDLFQDMKIENILKKYHSARLSK